LPCQSSKCDIHNERGLIGYNNSSKWSWCFVVLKTKVCLSQARGALGFIKRLSKEFEDPYITKTLFFRLSAQYYLSGVPNVDRIEYVQKNFFLFALRRLAGMKTSFYLLVLVYYSYFCQAQNDAWNSRYLYPGEIDCPDLVSQLNFSVSCRLTRN